MVDLGILTPRNKRAYCAIAKEKNSLTVTTKSKVDLLIKTIDGRNWGDSNPDGIEFITKDLDCAIIKSIKKIKQGKYLVLHELKHKGYEKIKEERLPNGAIRMVVEKWE